MVAGQMGRRWVRASAAGAVIVALTAGCSAGTPTNEPAGADFVLKGVSAVTEVAQLTGPGAINDTEAVGVAGTDLGSMVTIGDTTHFFFGDTFGERSPGSYGGQGGAWRSNVSALSTDSDPTDGISFDGWAPLDGIGLAAPLIEGDHDGNDAGGEVTKIPTYGFAIDGDLYVHFMSVRKWGDAGAWDANYAGLVKSIDGGNTWSVVDGVRWPGDSNFVQVATANVRDGGEEYVYLWGIPSGRFGGVQLMRVKASVATVENVQEYSYFTGVSGGKPRWSPDASQAVTVIDPTVGELSVMWSEYLRRWVMTYSDAGNAYIREGLAPWGPWGDPIEVVSGSDYPGLYAPYLSPRYVGDGGKRLYFTMSLWGPYNVFWFSLDLEKGE